MKNIDYAKSQDRWPAGGTLHDGAPTDATPLLGTWINTNEASRGIIKAVLTRSESDLTLQVFGAAEPEPQDWGQVTVSGLFADSLSSRRAISFTAVYDFGFLATELQTNIAKGLLIITSLNTFKDGSARSNYFSREYFYKVPGSG